MGRGEGVEGRKCEGVGEGPSDLTSLISVEI